MGQRRECRLCGCHTTTRYCGNCGSVHLLPVARTPGDVAEALELARRKRAGRSNELGRETASHRLPS